MYGLGRLIVIVLCAALIGLIGWQAAIRWHPSVEHYPVQGVDVDETNGAIEWNMVAAAGADFAYTVATRGAAQRDRTFEANWPAIEAAGLRRGAVHVWSLCQPAAYQADAFNTVVPQDDAALPATIHVDYDPACATHPDRATLVGDLKRAAARIETHTGKPVLLRLSRAIERDYRLSEAIPRPIWAIGNLLAPGYATRGWRMWRASDMRRIDGIEGPVNWDVAAR